jgi:hypothetical protein
MIQGGAASRPVMKVFWRGKKGGSNEENHYLGNGYSDNACIYRRMLAILV